MANFFKEEIDQVGDRLNEAIRLAGSEIQDRIETISEELHDHRRITKDEIIVLIDYATKSIGNMIDQRVANAKIEASHFISEKLKEVRLELTEAANEQKRSAVRNTAIAVTGSIIIACLSIVYKKTFHGELQLIDVFRIIFASLSIGYIIWFITKGITQYFQSNSARKDSIILSVRYFGILKPKGTLGHLVILGFVIAIWALLNFGTHLFQFTK